MDKKYNIWLLLGWGLCLLSLNACEAQLKGQSVSKIEIDVQANLAWLVKDAELLEQFSVSDMGIRFEPLLQEKSVWHIYPEEYDLTARLLRDKSSEEMVQLLDEKGTTHWKEEISRFSSKSTLDFHYTDSAQNVLSGLKVAIDPGHIAGNIEIAELEGKYVKMAPSRQTNFERIEFFEANLNLATAHLIREALEDLGAEVFMTRTEAGISSFGLDYWTWKSEQWDSIRQEYLREGEITEEQAYYYERKAPEDKIFNHFYVRQDLRSRAKIVNDFQPDLTLIIHYNVDVANWLERNGKGEFVPSPENYAMAFVPGAFMQGELEKAEDRVDFLRLLLNPQDLEASVYLSHLFLNQSLKLTEVPIVEEAQGLSYLQNASILTKYPGVYARNLSLSRMIKGPLIYGESLCQDHEKESLLLNKKTVEIEGVWVSERVKVIAQAYINAVLDYAKEL